MYCRFYIIEVIEHGKYCHICNRAINRENLFYKRHNKSLGPTQQFKNFFISYAKAINKAYQRTGALFEYPFKKIEIDSDTYFARLIHYIHFNPQKHGFTNDFRAYPHSSYQIIILDKPTTIQREITLKWFGGKEEFVQFHKNVAEEKEILKYLGDGE